ncbi:hypothetical protein [Halostella sp. PRR32]|nr:hypothetical protein [Halostella sp. PRR32]
MSADEFRATVDSALETAVAGDADLDEVEAVLEDARNRVGEVRTIRGDDA